jgi:hypothetical protein
MAPIRTAKSTVTTSNPFLSGHEASTQLTEFVTTCKSEMASSESPDRSTAAYTPVKSRAKAKSTAKVDVSPGEAGSGWTIRQKTALFNHVLKHGEMNWGEAVEGKSSKKVSALEVDQDWRLITVEFRAVEVSWFFGTSARLTRDRKTLLPTIRKTLGFF